MAFFTIFEKVFHEYLKLKSLACIRSFFPLSSLSQRGNHTEAEVAVN